MKERKQIEHDDCVICQTGKPHDVHKLADLKDARDARNARDGRIYLTGNYDQQELRVVADLMAQHNLARVELLPIERAPKLVKLVINGVHVQSCRIGSSLHKVVEEALKKGKL